MNSEPAKTSISDRLKKVADHVGGPKKLAELSSITERTLFNYLSGRNDLKASALASISAGTGVDLKWLVTGEGQMLVSDQKTVVPAGNATLLPLDSSGFVPVAVFDVHASAGGGAMNFGEVVAGYLSLPVSYLKDHLGVSPKDACGIYINGDSMEPSLEDGGVALLDRSENARSNKGDGIYTFRIGEELFIKRLERQGSRIVVHSDNPAYNPWEISDHDKANMKILARVVGTFRNL